MASKLWTCLKCFWWFLILKHSPPHLLTNTCIDAIQMKRWWSENPKSNSNGKNYSILKWQIKSHISFFLSSSFFYFSSFGKKTYTFYSKLSNATYVIYYHKIHRYLIYNIMENGIDFCVKFICHRKQQTFQFWILFGFWLWLLLTLNQARHWDANMVLAFKSIKKLKRAIKSQI